jgi:hypothetical protein
VDAARAARAGTSAASGGAGGAANSAEPVGEERDSRAVAVAAGAADADAAGIAPEPSAGDHADSASAPVASAPATTPLEHITSDIAAVLTLLPETARKMIDLSHVGQDIKQLEQYNKLQSKMTHAVEKEREARVHAAAAAAVAAAPRNSPAYEAALRNQAHLNSCDGAWAAAPPLAHLRLCDTYHNIRWRRYFSLPLPACMNIGGGAGSTARPPRSAAGNAYDVLGDFTLSVFNTTGANQWTDMHEQIKHFFFRAAKQAGLGSVTMEKRADGARTRHRPGDVRIGTTLHGWKVATGRSLLIDVTTISAVCDMWVSACAEEAGAGAKGKMNAKSSEYHRRGIIRTASASSRSASRAKATCARRPSRCCTPGPTCGPSAMANPRATQARCSATGCLNWLSCAPSSLPSASRSGRRSPRRFRTTRMGCASTSGLRFPRRWLCSTCAKRTLAWSACTRLIIAAFGFCEYKHLFPLHV